MLLTERFLKDLAWSALFCIFVYGVTHNPLTHPIPRKASGTWSIELLQHPLIFGIAGHNYLVLRDSNNDITEELHGLATDSFTGNWKYVGTRKSDILQVVSFNGPRDYRTEKSFPGLVLEEGTYDTVWRVWTKAKECIDPINQERTPYPPLGINIRGGTENSNSVAYTLAVCMGLDSKHLGLFTPGWKRDLLETVTNR